MKFNWKQYKVERNGKVIEKTYGCRWDVNVNNNNDDQCLFLLLEATKQLGRTGFECTFRITSNENELPDVNVIAPFISKRGIKETKKELETYALQVFKKLQLGELNYG